MNSDNLYIFDKKEKTRSLLGEIQSGFNMSLTIDGTKDSMSCIVWGYNESEIEPYTICWHEKTNTWWVVSHDKVERYLNDSGFIYIHNIELLGAIELLNARDLTDCGFNDNTYSFGDFIYRLFDLSNFEYSVQIIGDDLIWLGTTVNFIKTFENYTLLSALREFLDAYNYSAKLIFQQHPILHILEGCRLRIIPKTGVNTLTSHTMEDFDDVRETKTMDKNSFGTCVVSNAENVISKVAKTYPSTGAVKCSSHEYIIKAENAIIRLPSKVFQLNWLAMVNTRPRIKIEITGVGTFYNGVFEHGGNDFVFNPFDDVSFDNMVQFVKNNSPTDLEEAFDDYISQYGDYLKQILQKAYTVKLYNGIEINPQNGKPIKGPDMPYMVEAEFYSHGDNEPLVVCDKDTKQCLSKTWTAIAWERGSDEITGFDGFEPITGRYSTIYIRDFYYTELHENATTKVFVNIEVNGTSITITGIQNADSAGFNFQDNDGGKANVEWIVNYIPMSDIKIKVDNQRERNDIKLYNQNGKITDNFALSKLINSYAKEISSDNITRFMNYRNYANVPQVGSFVYDNNNEPYVINNVSLTFTQNENTSSDFGYFIEGEFTMSKYIATKSLMVNPNTNIRDYGIPQNYNVKRKQVYRDYYELNYSPKEETESITDFYLQPQRIFKFDHYPSTDFNFICVMRIDYDRQVNGATTYYYQLETTIYDLNKMIYILLDFKDNNIIGYGNQTSYAGFVISRIIYETNEDTLNVPVSYVDSEGQLEDLTILFMNNERITQAYYNYLVDSGYANSYNKPLYNYSVFIPKDIYDYCYGREEIKIYEQDYKKDALEVPVFEYGCQCEDTNEVLIGDDIFRQHDNKFIYFYSFVEGENLTIESVSTSDAIESLTSPIRYRMLNSARITFDLTYGVPKLKIRLFSATTYNVETHEWEDFTQNIFARGKDYAFFRHAYNQLTNEETIEKILIAKSVLTAYIDNNGDLIIYLNHYQLK